MVELEVGVAANAEGTSLKRKASQSPPPDIGSPKRTKLDGQNGHSVDDAAGTGAALKSREDAQDTTNEETNAHERVHEDTKAKQRSVSPPAKADPGRESPDRTKAEAAHTSIQSAGRRNVSQEEKRRGQRLFGGLLSTLSQTTASTQHKKRLEIERRQQERAQQQRAEDDKRRAEKLAKVVSARKIEQVKFDEQVMRTRHGNMLAIAHSLETKSSPKLYYRPWELTEAQERTVKEQIKAVKETIDDEKEEFKRRREQRLKELGALHSPPRAETTVGEPEPPEVTNPPSVVPATALPPKAGHDKEHEEHADEIEQDEEDTVLY